MRIGIVGGGLMGLALARHFSVRGHQVVIFERERQLGGLATYHDFGPFVWDRFYHVILPSDTQLIRFLREIGLGEWLRWKRTLTGFYLNQRFYSLSSGLEFLRFPLVSLLGKIRLAFVILYCSRVSDWRRLEQVSVEDWLIKMCGRATYERLWKPLLLAKLGEHYRRVSAVFIWSYVKRMFSARDASAQKEHLGHVSGGYKVVFDRLGELIRVAGGVIRTGVTVNRIAPHPGGGLSISSDGGQERFDKVIFTSPVNILERVASPELVRLANGRGGVEYLGVICMALVTRTPLVPYYVVNIADSRIPFTGVIGMSSVVSPEETAGRYLTYFPKYVLSDDPLFRRPDEELRELFLGGVRLMFPSLRAEEIESVHMNRASRVQPLQVLNYSRVVPQVATEHEDFYVVNTAQFVNATLNNNEVIWTVNEFLRSHGSSVEGCGASVAPVPVAGARA